MNSNISVDVLITFYNQRECVERAVKSVLSQKCDFPVNIIIGDDGSSDGTIDIIDRLAIQYNCISYVVMDRDFDKKYEPIERVSNLRKRLLGMTHSKYICYLDGDDYYTDNYKIAKQVAILEKYTDLVACAHNYTYFWEETNIKKIGITNLNEGVVSSDNYWKKMYIHNMAFLFRNITKGVVTPEINNMYFDDNTITLFYLQYGDFYYLKDSYCHYVQQENSSWNMRTNYEQHIINALDFYDEVAFAKDKYKNVTVRHFHNLKYLFLNKKNNSSKMSDFWERRIQNTGDKSFLYRLYYYKNQTILDKIRIHFNMVALAMKYLIYR